MCSLFQKTYDKIYDEAILRGFKEHELQSVYLDDLCSPEELSKIEMPQLIRMLVLAYYRGKLAGVKEAEICDLIEKEKQNNENAVGRKNI